MSDGMRRELVYLSSHATNRYFIPNWGITDKLSFSFRLILIVCNKIRQNLQTDQERETIILHYFTHLCNFLPTKHIEHQTVIAIFTLCGNILTTPVTLYHKDTLEDFLHQLSQTIFCL